MRAPFVTEAQVAGRVFVALTLLFLATAGGRITASDEYTMYRLTESLVTRRAVWVEAGNAERGPDGRLYPKAALGQAIAAAPFYAAGRLAALPVAPARRELVTRAVTSLLNAFVGGALGALLFLLFLHVGASPRGALFWAAATCLTTPLWVYAKSFLTEPLLALGLVAGLYGALRWRDSGAPRHALLAGLGFGGVVLVSTRSCPPWSCSRCRSCRRSGARAARCRHSSPWRSALCSRSSTTTPARDRPSARGTAARPRPPRSARRSMWGSTGSCSRAARACCGSRR